MEAFTRAAVIGIGNEFRRDGGVGWAVVALLRDRAAQRHLPRVPSSRSATGTPGGCSTSGRRPAS